MSNFFVSIWLACIRGLFTFLHIVCNSLQNFDSLWTVLKRKLELYSLSGVDSELYVSRFVTGMDCPSHLAVIVGDETVACQDFSNLVHWCLAAGVSFLTMYDQKGYLLQQETSFYKYCLENSSKIKERKLIFQNLFADSKCCNGVKQKLIVHVMSGSDGKRSFVDLVQNLARKNSLEGECNLLEQDNIYEHLLPKTQRPEPQLSIVVAPYLSTYGFPPWDLRLTEFVRVNSLSGINAKEFCRILRRYSTCEKRHGK